jgi:FAD/FMN-containing dehydrogenase
VIAYGMTRMQVVGVEAVLPNGSVITHMAGLVKDNTGFDLAGLLCGSEGTLAIITALRLRLHRPPGHTSLALVGVPSIDAALRLMQRHRLGQHHVLAVEVMDETSVQLAVKYLGQPWPLEGEHPFAVLLEIADGGNGSGLLIDDDADAVLAIDADQQAKMWKFRDHLGDAYSSLGIMHRLDVSIPLSHMEACLNEIRELVTEIPQVEVLGFFGHIGDGNIHVELFGPDPDDKTADRGVLECVARYGGSISAEHGVGRAKAKDLDLVRSPEEIAAMRSIKGAWDPRNLMNPGVIFAE